LKNIFLPSFHIELAIEGGMNFHNKTAEVFIPDGLPAEQALARTTHMAICAHPDDIEQIAVGPILDCFQRNDIWFTGVVLTDGRGSPRTDLYRDFSDETVRMVRMKEQKKAAIIGEYSAVLLLDYPSTVIKEKSVKSPIEDLHTILKLTHPKFLYTHNLADKHDTHVATTLKVISAIRNFPEAERPKKLYGVEVWRDLDWLVDADKVIIDVSNRENLRAALLGVFDSQISGGKRYDLASQGRYRANATYFESHKVDRASGLSFAMDLTSLIYSPEKDIPSFIQEHIRRFEQDVIERLSRLGCYQEFTDI
jgi:LmbE family N-acetylglucosaminyl deacetylase